MGLEVTRMAELASTPKRRGRLTVSSATIWRWVREGKFPAPFKLGERTTVWDTRAVDAWLEAQTRVRGDSMTHHSHTK